MADWNAEQYLRFKQQRTQPAKDLADHIRHLPVKTAVDIGCGPGNSTAVLRSVFPTADLVGIDNSPGMIEKAEKTHPELNFMLCGACDLQPGYDLLFSNACLQWIPEHEKLIPFLMSRLRDGGTLAVQIPMNGEETLYRIIREVTADPKWGFADVELETNETLSPDEYFRILAGCSRDFDIWETVYYHRMPSHEALLEWVRSTRLRPYLNALDETARVQFEAELLGRARAAYPVMPNGEILFRFRRFFFTAVK